MQKQVLIELKEIKSLMAKLIGTDDAPIEAQFSIEALNKAAKEFQKLSIERGDWVKDSDIHKYIKKAPWRAGTFIRTEFKFTNYIKRGREYYYSKKHLIALGMELKQRNIDLGRYIELVEDKANFQKSLLILSQNKKQKDPSKPYQLPTGLKDITTSDIPLPSVELIRQDIDNLKEEFFQNKYSEYINIYENNHAMMKHIYYFQKYIEPAFRNKCRRWCENFNYANEALTRMKVKKEIFIPLQESDMIQL
jgi:hypothetical protein